MANIAMKAYKVSEIAFTNKISGKMQLKLKTKVSHNVRYTSGPACEANLTVSVFDEEHKDALSITVTVTGLFTITNQVEKEFLHVEAYKELFPFAKALVTTVTANAGIPPVYVQNVDIENKEIYRIDMKPEGAEE